MSSLNLNKYASLAEYNADTRPVGEHNVSYIGNEYVIYDDEEMYDMQGNKIINWQNYLNFYMPNGGTVSLNKTGSPTVVELEYSLDEGRTYTVWAEDANGNRSFVLTAGQRMYVRNTSETQTRFSYYADNYYSFAFTETTYANGNVNSLLCKNADSVTSLTPGVFFFLFRSCTSLITAPEFPAENLADSCYAYALQFCSSLVIAPKLPATIPASFCYYGMFRYCTSLQKIITMMTDISATECTGNWLNGVAATGDFYCPTELTIPTGVSGIPSGWTRHDI